MNPLATASRPGPTRSTYVAAPERAARARTAGLRALGLVVLVLVVATVAGAIGAVASTFVDGPEFAVRPEVTSLLVGVDSSALVAMLWALCAAVLTAAVVPLLLLLRER